jgi:hypothetical protein
VHTTSSAHIATRSIPIVSNRPTGRGDRRLRTDAVGRGDEERLTVSGRDRERAAEPAQTADHLGSPGRVDMPAHELDRAIAGIDVDAAWRYAERRRAPPA